MHGLILAILAYSIWGGFPLYFSYLSHVAPAEVLAHRIVWSFIATLSLIVVLHRWHSFRHALNKKNLLWLGLSSLFNALNWLVFIWAVANQHVLEASLGYFIMPVVSLAMGHWILKEKMNRFQAGAGILALLAVAWELTVFGNLPWVAVVLSLAFAFYGLIRKLHPIDGLTGLTLETMYLLPITFAWLFWQILFTDHHLAFGGDFFTTVLLIGAGVLTALPLLLFAMAARRVDLSIVGFIMYINPTLQFLIGAYILNETFESERLVTFSIVWTALMLFMFGVWQQRKQRVKS